MLVARTSDRREVATKLARSSRHRAIGPPASASTRSWDKIEHRKSVPELRHSRAAPIGNCCCAPAPFARHPLASINASEGCCPSSSGGARLLSKAMRYRGALFRNARFGKLPSAFAGTRPCARGAQPMKLAKFTVSSKSQPEGVRRIVARVDSVTPVLREWLAGLVRQAPGAPPGHRCRPVALLARRIQWRRDNAEPPASGTSAKTCQGTPRTFRVD
jgi:hypothetical protein